MLQTIARPSCAEKNRRGMLEYGLFREPSMPKDNSCDIASKTDLNEVRNAVHQTMKEVRQRFDFKGSKSDIELAEHELLLPSDDELKLGSLIEILEQKLVKRSVSLKALSHGKVEDD